MALARRDVEATCGIATPREQHPVCGRGAWRRVLGESPPREAAHAGRPPPYEGFGRDRPQWRPALVRVLAAHWAERLSALRFYLELDDTDPSARYSDSQQEPVPSRNVPSSECG